MVLEKGCRALLNCSLTQQSVMNEVDKGECVKTVVLDLANAFDKVPQFTLKENGSIWLFYGNFVVDSAIFE